MAQPEGSEVHSSASESRAVAFVSVAPPLRTTVNIRASLESRHLCECVQSIIGAVQPLRCQCKRAFVELQLQTG